MNSNLVFQTVAVGVLAAHVGILVALGWSPRALQVLLFLNAAVAVAVLLYAATRARYIFAARDWPYVGLIAFELLVLGGAIWAFKGNRPAVIGSYAAFGLHGCVSVGAVIFAFAFKMTKLM